MLTLHAAGDLLASADSLDGLEAIATLLGCSESSPLDALSRHALALDNIALDVRIAAGPGSIRALLIRASDLQIRDMLATLASRLASRAPHVLWLVIATQERTNLVTIAAWNSERRPPRVRALVADRTRIVDSDAETLRALSTAVSSRDLLVHSRWVEVLGRDALTARFYRRLERAVGDLAESSRVGDAARRREIALLDTSRLLFLCFLEAKGWLDGNQSFLARQFDACLSSGGGFHRRVLRPLFFGTLNTPLHNRAGRAIRFGRVPFLNGGLFARTSIERTNRDLVFSDDAYGSLIYDLFSQYRFTAAEETVTWSEAAVDPEMLGRAFESLMAATERQKTGAFFTPFSLVQHVANSALDEALDADRVSLDQLTVLDPACGSGAFLVHVLERIASRMSHAGDRRDAAAIRREVLTRSIFGVDVNPTAVWLCQLRLWLSVVIESTEHNPMKVVPLPNLDRNIRVGDALSGAAFNQTSQHSGGAALRRLRERYARASGPKKRDLSRQLDRAERARAVSSIDDDLHVIAIRRCDLLSAQRGRDLFGDRYRPSREERDAATTLRQKAAALRATRRRIVAGGALPFSFGVHFADVAARGGFSLVIGNPPWVRLHRIPPVERLAFRRDYIVARAAPWQTGADAAGASAGFAGQIDLAALFIERAVNVTAPAGAIALLVPSKLWRSLAGGGVRRLLAEETTLRRVEDYSDAAALFDAAVYPSLVLAKRRVVGPSDCIDVVVHHRGRANFGWRIPATSIAFDDSPGAPWILLPPDARKAFALLHARGTSLARSALGRPLLGVKCGCNDAFIVRVDDISDDTASVTTSDDSRIVVERSMLRPLLRGEQLRRWNVAPSDEAILWTHDASDAAIAELPPLTKKWLQRWRTALTNRADAKHRARWWSLFRVEGARSDLARVVWCDVGREPRALVLDAHDPRVPLNTCYVARCRNTHDAHALAALLNSPLARAWLDTIAEPARGGYKRYLGWTTALLPLPSDWAHARDILAPLSERARFDRAPNDPELLAAACAAYELEHDQVAPLVAWATP
ncbi:MAG TPA: N-6 DNA methylase [Gemmatimonadaceae bacterium]